MNEQEEVVLGETAPVKRTRKQPKERVSARDLEAEKGLEDFLFGSDDLEKTVKEAKFGKELSVVRKARKQARKKQELFTFSTEGSDHEGQAQAEEDDDSESDTGHQKKFARTGIKLVPALVPFVAIASGILWFCLSAVATCLGCAIRALLWFAA